MVSVSTMDTDAAVSQTLRIANEGADYVRLTAQGVREAENLGVIRRELHSAGCDTPLVADIHFNPKAAFEAARRVEKVRINPGNFVDPGRTFRKIEYTDAEYANELGRLRQALLPFIELCRQNSTAVRIGVNHGSLSDRIMSRYGDTPAGMAESAMEFLRVFRDEGFNDVVISLKASNVRVMVEGVRRLVRAMDAEGMAYPLHLGVTEAGDGEDGRIKSAVGIGTLLADGLGDTIRVSLSEPPENEIPVARELVKYISARKNSDPIRGQMADGFDPIAPSRRTSCACGIIGGDNTSVVVAHTSDVHYHADSTPDVFLDRVDIPTYDVTDGIDSSAIKPHSPVILRTRHSNPVGSLRAAIHSLTLAGYDNPVIVALNYDGCDSDTVKLRAAADAGPLLLDGLVDGIMIDSDAMTAEELSRLSFSILQATRLRMTRTEYIACPGCGRTLFDLPATLAEIRSHTQSLTGLKIGVMGCIVNGPGEMADADYGYVGAAAGHVSLYRGKECIERNIPREEAVSRLIQLIKADGRWK